MIRSDSRTAVVLALAMSCLGFASCFSAVGEDADGGFQGNLPDGGAGDSGILDSGTGDAGMFDAGMLDAGTFDAGMLDAGMLDAGIPDSGIADAGAPDAGGARCTATAPCAPSGYKFEQTPQCGSYCYYDELHNIALNGAGQNPAGFDQYALGQLTDGIRGNADWTVNTGSGPGFEWVGWLYLDPSVVFQFATRREFSSVHVGLNNHGTGAVYAPSEVRVQFGDDGVTFGTPSIFRRSDGTLPIVPVGSRGDVQLPVPGGAGRFVRFTLVYSAGWTMVDEVSFE